MRLLRSLFVGLSIVTLVNATQTFSQSATQGPRILERVDENQLVTLKGNIHPLANSHNDLGPVRPDLAMTDIVLVLSRSPEQQAAFDDFVAGQYDTSSPNFHHWLQPAEVGERFGPSLADIATISSWLASRGLSVAAVSKDRMSIRFGGTAAQVESAFHTEIHNLSVDGEKHIANMSDPQIPAALSPVVVGVKALHDFKPKPQHRLGSKVTFDSSTGKWQRIAGGSPIASALGVSAQVGKVDPDFGITVGTGSNAVWTEDVAPYDFATIYNVLPLWNATTPITGTGQTIAVAGTSDIALADVATFRSAFGLPAGLTPEEVKGANGLDPGICTGTTGNCTIDDLTENSLDVEWSGAVAPGAQIVLVTSGVRSATDDTVYDSSSYVVENAGVPSTPVANAHILSVSYGLCELGEGTGGNAAYNNLWETAATEGIAVFVATGDAGSATCDQDQGGTSPSYRAEYGLSVSGLASSPYDTAVGGTDLNWGSTPAPYWNATNSTTTGASAKGYIPEVPWNDTCTNPIAVAALNASLKTTLTATQMCDEIYTGTVSSTTNETGLQSLVNVVGAGGGVSACTTSDGQTVASCTGGYAKPSWQAGVTGIPADGKRDVPDVSFFAANGFLGSAYLICVSANGSCSYSSTTEPITQEVGGTSVATPAMAGVMALINQKAGAPQGNPNAELYSLAGKESYASCSAETVTVGGSCYFNDIDTGTNAMPCDYSDKSPNCVGTNQVGILSGYSATAGFDTATGLGSLNVANVVNGWTAPATSTGTATVTVTPAATAITVAQPLSVTVNVSATSGTPTGTIDLVGPGYVGTIQTLSTGPYTFNIPPGGLSGGTDTLVASYSGDSNFAPASSTATVTVSKLVSAITVTPSATSINSNAALTVTGAISGSGPTPTGTVTLTGGGYTSGTITLSSGSYSVTIPANSLIAGADTLTVSYSGDADYAASTGMATVTVTETVYAVSAAAAASVSPGGSTASTVTISSATGYAGTVTVTCALTNSPTGASNLPGCAAKLGNATVTLSSTTTTGAATVTVTTTAATTGALRLPGNGKGLAGAGSAVLAILVLFGIPARRRAWRAMLGVLALMAALGSLAACGGGGSGSGGSGGSGNAGTTAGTYTFTVTGVGSPALTPAPTATFTVIVN
jgi:subtilase family serine protease